MSKILLLEDDLSLINGLSFAFKKQGFELNIARTLKEADALWADGRYDLLVLDVSLPDGTGFDFCREVRRTSGVPILFLTASDEEMDIITGLDLGGDDYITKPFGMLELISRIKAVLRRTSDNPSDYELHAGDITVNPGKHRVMVNGENVILTYKEFEMLCMLIESKGLVLSRNKLLESIWGYDFDGETRTIDVHIRSLRSKLGESGNIIETVRGVGYKIGADYET